MRKITCAKNKSCNMKKFRSAMDTLIITVKSKVDGLRSKWTFHWDRDILMSPYSQKLIQKPESSRFKILKLNNKKGSEIDILRFWGFSK